MMESFLLDLILVAITVATAIVAALLDKPGTAAKVLLITLAVASGAATLLKSFEDDQDKEFSRGALSALLVSGKESPFFRENYTYAMDEIAQDHDLSVRGVSAAGYDSMAKKNQEGKAVAMLLFNEFDRAELYRRFAAGQNIKCYTEELFFPKILL